ncbi:uncharacterized protein PV09_03488 [Verruconis gallopava]|uniref:Nuclear segregation protein Bfr1 n=1 Tax=Verruconis gallopava TaxID=253628 RepID=A0A0D1YY57_9PEZI|nr:uncharacterized protein PV09_03488 [Verruconis gallopava]KIW05617.1 hypothetical protein PV09_03488 [Verruconis gallopava]
MVDTAASPATESKSKNAIVKPEKPDEEAFKKRSAELEKAHKAKQDALKAVKDKLDLAKPKEGSPVDTRRKELLAQLAEIRKIQAGGKESRQAIMDKIKRLDEQVKSRIQEQKNAKSKVPYKSVDEIDRQIAQLQKQVDGGMMKLVDEKKALNEISQLNRAKKSFGSFDQSQKSIDELKNQIAELKKSLDDPEAKALSEKYNSIQNELNKIKSDQDEVYKNLNSLRDQRTKLQAEQQEAWNALKAYKDEHYEKKRAYREYENEAYRIRREKQKKEQEEYYASKRREAAQKRLEEASAPAYQDEIMTAEGLIRYFDPSSAPAKEAAAPGKYAAAAQRTVNDDAFKGMKVVKKDDEDFMNLGGGKKKKGGKKGGAASATEKFNLNIGVLEDLSKVKVDAPSSQADVPHVVEQLKEKIAQWKADQDRKTQENIAKAKKEIEKLEAEAQAGGEGSTDHARKPAQKNAGLNGHASAEAELAQEKDAIADAAKELAEAKIEDNA